MGAKRSRGKKPVWAVMLQKKEAFDGWGSECIEEEPIDVYPFNMGSEAHKVAQTINMKLGANERVIVRKEFEGVYA